MGTTLDFTRPLKTRDGREVTIYCTDAPGEYSVHGRIAGGNEPQSWTKEGLLLGSWSTTEDDLVQAPETFQVRLYVVVDRDGSVLVYHGVRAKAHAEARVKREPRVFAFMTIDREVTDGEGLDAHPS